MGGIVLGILVWQEGGEAVGLLLALAAVSFGSLAWWLVRRKRAGKAVLLDPDLFKAKLFRFGVSGQVLQQIGLGGTMIALRSTCRSCSSTARWERACPSPRSR
jgi:hypothetical protein